MPINLEGASAVCKDCKAEVSQGTAQIEAEISNGTAILRGGLVIEAGNHHAKFRNVVQGREDLTQRHADMEIYSNGAFVGEVTVTSHGNHAGIEIKNGAIQSEFNQELMTLRRERALRNREDQEGGGSKEY